jgi:hypothetical protein
MGRAAKGRSIANILEFKPNETIAALIRILSTQGVKLINLEPSDKLQAIAPVISEETGDTEAGAAPAAN